MKIIRFICIVFMGIIYTQICYAQYSDSASCRGYSGPGGACYSGPDGGLYSGPGGGLYSGPGGGIYTGPPSNNGYKGPWSPCITGVLGKKWMTQNCPN